MNTISTAELISWPDTEPQDNFSFQSVTSEGAFTFNFKWINDAWSLWVTLPDETVRQAGVYPNVVSWTGYPDYGLVFQTSLEDITYNSLFSTSLYILSWS